MCQPRHPKGIEARILLTSIFGPFAQDDSYGSRSINPMELYHNQVTRVQGPFSLRMFHRSWGLMMIQANIDAPSKLLDFPTLERFSQEIRDHSYDIVGISAIIPNVGKVKKMCEVIRAHQPRCTIVVGGHISNLPGIEERINADYIVRGEGISWFRRFLGQDDSRPIRHPEIVSGIGARTMGIRLRNKSGDVAATLIPSVGCPMGCNFCATSAMFGGKGKFVNFYETGEDLFQIMSLLEERMKVHSFFVMDENFLLHRRRALELLDLMKAHRKPWSLYIFSSVAALQKYTADQLLGLGVSWVWMGLEGENSSYTKLQGADTRRLVRDLQSHGIRILGSSIIGLETHTPANMDRVIDHAIAHDTDFHQFMLYTPIPGTPLHAEHRQRGTLLHESDEADNHGQFQFNFVHPHISREQSGQFLLRAFERDYQTNGPSILRIVRTLFLGWKRHKNHPDDRIRNRIRREGRNLPTTMAGTLWAMERYFRRANPALSKKIRILRSDIEQEFGIYARLCGPLIGSAIRLLIRMEERRLARAWTYEPPTFVDLKNWNGSEGLQHHPAPTREARSLDNRIAASPWPVV